jgi:hypothetical protein
MNQTPKFIRVAHKSQLQSVSPDFSGLTHSDEPETPDSQFTHQGTSHHPSREVECNDDDSPLSKCKV